MPTLELTDKFCRTARAFEGKQTDYFDTVRTGLYLRVFPTGVRTWMIIYTKPGGTQRVRMKLGRYPEVSLGQAREKARDARAQIIDGTDPVVERRAQAASQTVDDLVENYIARHAATKRSKDEIARRLRKNVSGVIGSLKLSDLHRRDITRCIDAVKDRGAGVEANRLFEDVRSMVRWAKGRGDLDDNLVEGMKRPTETIARDRVLSADEIKTMWGKLADADMFEGTRNVIRLCLLTAQRVGEISGMLRSELDLKERVWVIPPARSKNKREHVVPLSDASIDIIEAQMAAVEKLSKRMERPVPDFVFPGPGARAALSGAAIAKAVKRMEVTAKGKTTILGVSPWTPHDLRRSAATHMEEIGISPFIVGHVLNHVSVTRASITSRVYARYDYGREKRDALDLWADRVSGIIAGRQIAMLGAAA